MVIQIDPYAELGIPRDADDKTIRAAYKRKAKASHPDTGGDEEAFRRVQLAYEVLSDAGRRERYDENGTIEESAPDNGRAAAIGIVETHILNAVNAYIHSGLDPARDPRRRDVLADVRAAIKNEIRTMRDGAKVGTQISEFLRDMAGRFEGDSAAFLRRSFERRLADNEAKLAIAARAIAVHEGALALLKDGRFRHDADGGFVFAPAGLIVGMRPSY